MDCHIHHRRPPSELVADAQVVVAEIPSSWKELDIKTKHIDCVYDFQLKSIYPLDNEGMHSAAAAGTVDQPADWKCPTSNPPDPN